MNTALPKARGELDNSPWRQHFMAIYNTLRERITMLARILPPGENCGLVTPLLAANTRFDLRLYNPRGYQAIAFPLPDLPLIFRFSVL